MDTINFDNTNPLLAVDVYKTGHMLQYKDGCEKVYSYLIARSDKTYSETVFFGLQYYLKKYLTLKITSEHVEEFIKVYGSILNESCNTDIDKMNNIDKIKIKLNKLVDIGYFPVRIRAVPEGTVVPVKNILMSIENTLPEFYWTVGYLESLILKVWYTISVATTSHYYRKLVNEYFDLTVDKEFMFLKPFMVHDFGYRGDTSEESASISGVAHLLSFSGSDTVCALPYAVKYYGAKYFDNTLMQSVPASEHSVMCSFGKEKELDAYRHMLKLYPTGIVSIVSDTYDIYHVLTEYITILKDEIMSRDGKVVFRPDSGNQEYIICGDPNYDPSTPQGKGCIRLLEEVFGSTVNSKGYKVLNPKIGLIYGDGMYLTKYEKILQKLKDMGYSTMNLVIGVGGILRNHTRDTLGFAFKATSVTIDGTEVAIMKDPVTDVKKKSHTGYIRLDYVKNKFITTSDDVTYESFGDFITTDHLSSKDAEGGLLQDVYIDGNMYNQTDIYTIRHLINNNIIKN
jgi:nicotinamide phosphoribosyltransferase